MKKCVAEALGTFALVFAGTGAIVINDTSNGAVTHVGIALTFGLVVLAMIYAVGDISGAHLNPTVTLGFLGRATLAGACGARLCDEPSKRGVARQRDLAIPLPKERPARRDRPGGRTLAILRARTDSQRVADVRDSERLHRGEGKRHHRGCRRRRGHQAGSDVCRADLR